MGIVAAKVPKIGFRDSLRSQPYSEGSDVLVGFLSEFPVQGTSTLIHLLKGFSCVWRLASLQ